MIISSFWPCRTSFLKSFCGYVFISLEQIPKRKVAIGRSMFKFMKNYQSELQNSSSILNPRQQCMRVPIALSLFFFLTKIWCCQSFTIFSHYSGCEVTSPWILICNSLVTNNIKHLFMWSSTCFILWSVF